ncbi:Trimethylguanosine synthase [Tyrophagus putrescentiae]|nr:Trimethylguanosine synthase [Tyrophagus putrescentiae]
MSPSPPEVSAAGDSSSVVVMSAVDHSADQISQEATEQLEMPHRSPPPDGFELIDFDDHEEEETADAAELTAGVEEADVTSLGTSSGGSSGPDEVATLKLADDSYDFIELDKLRISVSADDEDCPDQQQQVMNKRDRSENDNMTTTSSEISREDQLLLTSFSSSSKPKKKRSKRQLNTTYFKQRFLFFSRFDEGIRLDSESWYSVTPEPIARHIAERIERELISHSAASSSSSANQFIIRDGFCGAGGNTIQFALMPSTALVYAVDIDLRKIELARHNASIYGCLDKIQFIVADFFEVIQGDRLPCSLVDACFLSPPWGQSSSDNLTYESYSLAQMTPRRLEIVRRVADRVTKNISFLLPRNFDMGELPSLSSIVYQNVVGGEMEKSVKTLTAYFGHLVIRKEGDDGDGGGDDDEKKVSALFKTAQVCSPPPIYLADEDEEEEEEEE